MGQLQLCNTFSPLRDPGLRRERKTMVGPHNGFYSIYSGGVYVVSAYSSLAKAGQMTKLLNYMVGKKILTKMAISN